MQQGMLFHRLQGGAAGVDVEQVICELRERIQAAPLEQAWREVIARHAALRTEFQWEDGRPPRQVVHPPTAVRLNFYHAEFGSEREARFGLEEYLSADRREGFLALMPPLLRIALLRGGPEHFWLIVTYHHLALDARSMTLMFREAFDRHDALMQGRELEMPAPRAYRSYIDWLRTHDLKRAEAFWREYLRDFVTPTPLPAARAAQDQDGKPEAAGEISFRLSPARTRSLRAVARRYDATLNTVVQAAWAVVLGRHAGEDEVMFGAVRACRKIPVEGAESMIGLFINTVPVRATVRADMRVSTCLRELRQQWVALRDYEHTPLMNVRQWSGVPPGCPLFETIISYQEPAWDAALHALGGPWTRRHFDIRAQPNYPLALEILGGETLTVKFVHDPGRFTSEAIAGLAGHYRTALEALAEDAYENIGDVPILTSCERHRVIEVWNRTAVAYPAERSITDEVEARTGEAPERIAVTDAANALTYGELNARANRLAHRLRTLGAGAGSPVAVCMDRSVEMVVAWLGVLKAGGAFVPLDPAYPRERLAFQLADCGARVVLTQPRIRPALPTPPGGITIVDLTADGRGFEGESDLNPPFAGSSRDLAYVIYTSGSTGQPKGVEIEHRSLMNLVTWHRTRYAVTGADRATHLASPAFDAAVWEIWPYLAAGASVHLPDDETRLAPAQLWRWLAEKKITIAFMPTPLAEAAMNETWPGNLALRAILTGGDRLNRRPPANFPCPLINHYGPTESTVVTTCATVDASASAPPTIGRPIANTQTYVLDRHFRPVPAGVAGELFIGGESLARGYLRRPDLTAEKFVTWRLPWCEPAVSSRMPDDSPSARSEAPVPRQVRLYRTGDLVRWTPQGELEFLGRMDGQVKIRGCRVELGEIEATLRQHPAGRDCVVLARPDERGQTQLVAYILAPSDGAEDSENELAEFLRARLPAYMAPSAIVLLRAWPLTPNGKIDRKALPAPRSGALDSRVPFAAPRTTIELTVAGVWAEVLGCKDVGLNDNFFDLGGHSLLAAQVVTRLNGALPAAVSVRALFDQPTLAAFVREVEAKLECDPASRAPLHRVKRRMPRPELELVAPH